MKVRQNLYIDRELSDALEALATKPGSNKSRLVNDALASWLARRGAKEVDDLLKVRLDRLSREIGHARRDLEVLLESLSLFVRYQLTVTAPCPSPTRRRSRSAAIVSKPSSRRSVARSPRGSASARLVAG